MVDCVVTLAVVVHVWEEDVVVVCPAVPVVGVVGVVLKYWKIKMGNHLNGVIVRGVKTNVKVTTMTMMRIDTTV